MQHAVWPAPHPVASVEPTAAPGGFGRRLVVEIAREAGAARRPGRMAHHKLAGLAIGDVAIGVVDDAHFDARPDAAEGARADLARLDAVAQHPRHLGHAPDLDHGKAEALLEGRMQLGPDARADA